MKHFILLFPISMFVLFACTRPPSKSLDAPASDLGHIDVILDSVSWYAIKNNTFIQNEFAVLESDTTYYGGKPSYDLYLLGQNNFLHISLASGFWQDQQKGGAVVFQTQQPGKISSLLNTWKSFYTDSLFLHTYKGKDFELDELMVWYPTDSAKPKEATMFSNLTSYSVNAYKNWGITDSIVQSGQALKQFMSDWGGEKLGGRLFSSISELYMVINELELRDVRSALLATGYKEKSSSFTHPKNPTVYVEVSEEKGRSKYSKVKFKLNRPVAPKELVLSPMVTMQLNGENGWFLFK